MKSYLWVPVENVLGIRISKSGPYLKSTIIIKRNTNKNMYLKIYRHQVSSSKYKPKLCCPYGLQN